MEMAEDIRKLVDKVYVDLLTDSRDLMGKNHFVDARNDSEIRTRVIQMQTSIRDEAVAAAVELEALQRVEKERRLTELKKVRYVQISQTVGDESTEQGTPEVERQLREMAEQLEKMQKQMKTRGTGWINAKEGKTKGQGSFACQKYGHVKRQASQARETTSPKPEFFFFYYYSWFNDQTLASKCRITV